MNYLAHTLLSKRNIDYQLGNLLSDTLKGREWAGCSLSHRQGLAMHKAIDRFTDESPIVDQAITRLGRGYLKGVIVDILFDHFLSKHWEKFVTISQKDFTADFYQNASLNLSTLSPHGKHFTEKVLRHDILNAYATFDSLAIVFTRFDRRLSNKLRSKESATDYLPRLAAKYSILENDFLTFFPTLIDLFLTESYAKENEHFFQCG